jgi:hypothetical protein
MVSTLIKAIINCRRLFFSSSQTTHIKSGPFNGSGVGIAQSGRVPSCEIIIVLGTFYQEEGSRSPTTLKTPSQYR